MTQVQKPTTIGLQPSLGFGDRLGLATLGHLDALRSHGGSIQPFFAQQSIREMQRTCRKPSDVIEDAFQLLCEGRYFENWGADANYLKTQEDINITASAGFTLFTIDPSDHIDPQADYYDPSQLEDQFSRIRRDVNWADRYINQTIRVQPTTTLILDRTKVFRVAVKFGRAIAHAIKLAAHIERVMAKQNREFEIELCLNETTRATSPEEHWIVAEQCLRSGMNLVSIAPNFGNGFLRGAEFQGDRADLEQQLESHASIARTLGPYKLSLHFGSDKFSIYGMLARTTQGRFHVKTAGTSYLEALRVAARCERKLFRRIVERSRERFDHDKKTYHMMADPAKVPTPAAVGDDAMLERLYLDEANGRQLMHVTYGSILTDRSLGPVLRDVLTAHPETYREILKQHFGRHLQALTKELQKVA